MRLTDEGGSPLAVGPFALVVFPILVVYRLGGFFAGALVLAFEVLCLGCLTIEYWKEKRGRRFAAIRIGFFAFPF